MITPIYEYLLDLIENELNNNNKDSYLILFSIYFLLILKGNICMSLDEKKLSKKWEQEISDAKTLAIDNDKLTIAEKTLINTDFDNISSSSNDSYKYLNNIQNLNVVTVNRIFEIVDNYLYIRKYNNARIGIIDSIKKLYSSIFHNKKMFDLSDALKDGFKLEDKQIESVEKGLNNNLIITGGPGTGKTTSILFILLYLLANDLKYNIYLAAASGKASSRMKESIINGLDNIKDEFKKNNKNIIDKISGSIASDELVEEFTIHRLLGVSNNGFKYKKDNQFQKNSIFIIDEASMIDINLFNSLLESIPTGARVFILGDKDQLPSVEVGAVFGDLVGSDKLKDKVIKLDVSRRFTKDTYIYKLADEVNTGNKLHLNDKELTYNDFNNSKEFKLEIFDKKFKIYY